MHSRFLYEIIFGYTQVFSFKPLTFFSIYCTIEWIKKVIKSGTFARLHNRFYQSLILIQEAQNAQR